MIDKKKLENDLTLINIMYLYDFMSPFDYCSGITAEMLNGRKDAAIKRYQNDVIFHARVDQIVAHTMNIVVTAQDDIPCLLYIDPEKNCEALKDHNYEQEHGKPREKP